MLYGFKQVKCMNYPLLWKLADGLYLQHRFCTMKDIAMELCEDFLGKGN